MSEPKRRPRRASAPPTKPVADGASATPDADWGQWLKSDDADAAAPKDAREKWFHEQRPPHWG